MTITYNEGETLESPINQIYYILKLEENNLWVKYNEGGNTFKYYFIPAQ
jgi:hypothetical protein